MCTIIIATPYRISQIRGSFRRQILRLSDRKTLLDRTRQSCTLDREALTVSERSHNDEQNMIGSLEMCSKMWCERVRGEVVSLRRAAEVLFNKTTVVSYPLHTSPKEELFLCLRDRLLAADAVLNSTLKAQVRFLSYPSLYSTLPLSASFLSVSSPSYIED